MISFTCTSLNIKLSFVLPLQSPANELDVGVRYTETSFALQL